jgi:hypothetical protein
VLKVAVRKPNVIGKFTRFAIRANRAPRRTDSCVYPGRSRPAPCPGA